jgi:hypothetical protein
MIIDAGLHRAAVIGANGWLLSCRDLLSSGDASAQCSL